ncbi:hypothetical protein [Bacillus phage FI_KG-Lek]|nr:hypothetical protein [Bacillus phage FI_KG-Lek]
MYEFQRIEMSKFHLLENQIDICRYWLKKKRM